LLKIFIIHLLAIRPKTRWHRQADASIGGLSPPSSSVDSPEHQQRAQAAAAVSIISLLTPETSPAQTATLAGVTLTASQSPLPIIEPLALEAYLQRVESERSAENIVRPSNFYDVEY